VRHAAGQTRPAVAGRLDQYQGELKRRLSDAMGAEFSRWATRLSKLLEWFEEWLRLVLTQEMDALSAALRPEFAGTIEKVGKQVFRSLQEFRNRLSERTERTFGVPLRTTESEIAVDCPRAPDIRIGHVFDRNWELLSPIIPMWLFRGMVKNHFRRMLPRMIEKNLSRLASQWQEILNSALFEIEKEAGRRIGELLHTVDGLLATDKDDSTQVQAGPRQRSEPLHGAGLWGWAGLENELQTRRPKGSAHSRAGAPSEQSAALDRAR